MRSLPFKGKRSEPYYEGSVCPVCVMQMLLLAGGLRTLISYVYRFITTGDSWRRLTLENKRTIVASTQSFISQPDNLLVKGIGGSCFEIVDLISIASITIVLYVLITRENIRLTG